MKKIIRKFKNKELTYELGYNLWKNKVCLRIEIYNNNKLLSVGRYSINNNLFCFNSNYSFFSSASAGYVESIKEMFIGLRQYYTISEEIEQEYENIFFMYKINNLNEF